MARLWSAGFELNSTGSEFLTSTGSPTILASDSHSGSFCGRITTMSSGTRKGFYNAFSASPADGPYFARTYLKIITLPSAENCIFLLKSPVSVGLGTNAVQITLDSGGLLRLYRDGTLTALGTQIGSASSALSTGIWYRLEVQYDRSPAVGSEIIRARIDGVEFAGASNLTITNQIVAIAVGGNLITEAQTTGDWRFDDIAINSSSGTAQNSWPGDGYIVHMNPDAAGDNNMASAGTYADIDEVTPDDNTTKVVLDANNDIIDVNMETAANAGIPTGSTITLVQVGSRHAAPDTSSSTTQNLRIKSQASGTVVSGTTLTETFGTTYRTHQGSTPLAHFLTSYTDPQAGGAWTIALLDTAQIGMIATDADPDVWLSTLWALVEYVQPAATRRVMNIT